MLVEVNKGHYFLFFQRLNRPREEKLCIYIDKLTCIITGPE